MSTHNRQILYCIVLFTSSANISLSLAQCGHPVTVSVVEIKNDGETLEDGEVNEDAAPKGFYPNVTMLRSGFCSRKPVCCL